MSMMFFLPNILLSGFMFPLAGMPDCAQNRQVVPLTHFIRIICGIMLEGADVADLRQEMLPLRF
jgi:ABC-2 type transport system permease protein